MKVFISNDLAVLADALCQKVFTAQVPFEKKWIVVPSEEIKMALYCQWLSKVEVVAGIRTITYRELVGRVFPSLPSKMELAFLLEANLEPMEYLEKGGAKRKLDFCDELSFLFLEYLKRPKEEIVQWLQKEGWQQRLWKKVFGDIIPTDQIQLLKGCFFFYHPTQLTPYEWAAFSQIDSSWFLFSPSEMFLGDFQSERQQHYLLKKVKKGVREDLENYFEQDSPLLSNWGVCGRKLLQFFENEQTSDLFQGRQEDSMLHSLQEEWRALEKKEALCDPSIELHSSPNLLKEVEVVWDLIQQLPEGVVILAPDIAVYQVAIEWVFAQRGGSYAIRGLEARAKSEVLQGIETILSLPKYRFSADQFEKLLLCSPFLKRFNLSSQDAETLLEWISDLHVRHNLSGWHEAFRRAVGGTVPSDLIEIILKIEESFSTIALLRTLDQWADFLEHLVETFFFVDEMPNAFNSFLLTLRNAKNETLFSYESVERAMQTSFSNRSGSSHSGSHSGTRFSSLKPGAVTFAKTIILMGQQERAISSNSCLAQLPILNQIKEDRALFLEAIASAQEKLILTYTRSHPEDGKPVKPCSLIEELIKDRKGITTIHHLSSVPIQKPFSISHGPLASPQLNKIIYISALRKLARHPIQFFFEQSLKVRFPLKKKHSEFLFSPLEMHRLRSDSLQRGAGEIIDELEAQGKLPSGPFRAVACQTIETELQEYHAALAKIGVDRSAIFSLELTPQTNKLTQLSQNKWVAPSIKIRGTLVQGNIEGLTPKGLLYHGDESVETLLKVWPIYCLSQVSLATSSLLLTKKGDSIAPAIKDPHVALDEYMDYWERSLISPSPLLPAWGRRILKGGKIPEKCDDEIVQWGVERRLLPTPAEWIATWCPYLSEVFREL